MKPRIAMVTPYPLDFCNFSGGVETSVAGLLEGLRKYQEEFEFHVISVPKGLKQDAHILHDGFHFHFVAIPFFSELRPRFPYRVVRVIRAVKQISPALVHCQGSTDLALAAIWSGYPRIFTIHGIKREEANKRIGWEGWCAKADALIEPYIYRNFEDVICISRYAEAFVGNMKHTYMIPNAVRSAFFDVRRDCNSNLLRLLFVGLLSPLKRPMDLIKSHQRLRKEFPSLQTIFCGGGESQRYFRYLLSHSGDGIIFEGYLDQKQIITELGKATALVLPSAQENSPIVIGEAMAAGVPVVATNIGGIPEMLGNGLAGSIYNVGDVTQLVTTLRNILTDPVYRMNLSKEAQIRAQNDFTPEKVAYQTINTYRKLLRME